MYKICYWPNGEQKVEEFIDFREMMRRLTELHAKFGIITVYIVNNSEV